MLSLFFFFCSLTFQDLLAVPIDYLFCLQIRSCHRGGDLKECFVLAEEVALFVQPLKRTPF